MSTAIPFQRLEAATIFLLAIVAYFHNNFSLLWFAVLLLSFDVSMLGYLINARVGAFVYNLGHSMFLPCLVLLGYAVNGSSSLLGLACLWFAHIGMDRALGYGLKLNTGFKHTHLGKIGQ